MKGTTNNTTDSITDNEETSAVDHVKYRLERSIGLVGWLSDELDHLARVGHRESAGAPEAEVENPEYRRIDRMVDQLAIMCRLVSLSLEQVRLHDDLGMGWILLEQARQQLGHAATTATTIDRGRCLDDDEVDREIEAMLLIAWFLQRDRMPWPENAAQVVDFGFGPGLLPDFRPDTAFELVPLQMLVNAVMCLGTGTAVQELPPEMLMMAYGEYVGTIMGEAMELLEARAGQEGELSLAQLAETGDVVANLVSGAYPPPWQIFRGPAGLPDVA